MKSDMAVAPFCAIDRDRLATVCAHTREEVVKLESEVASVLTLARNSIALADEVIAVGKPREFIKPCN